MIEFELCDKCGKSFPLTEEFWHRNKSTPSGFATSMCKKCRRAYCADRAHGYREKQKEKKQYEAESFGDFEAKALGDKVKRMDEPVISIYREI